MRVLLLLSFLFTSHFAVAHEFCNTREFQAISDLVSDPQVPTRECYRDQHCSVGYFCSQRVCVNEKGDEEKCQLNEPCYIGAECRSDNDCGFPAYCSRGYCYRD